MATLTEIARKAKVSKALVSRLLSGDPTLRISDSTHDRIMAIYKKIGTDNRRNIVLGRNKKLSYNIVCPINREHASEWTEFGDLATSPLIRSLRLFLKSKGFRLSFGHFNPSELVDEITDYVHSPEYCDGLFLYYGVVDQKVADVIRENKFPHVSLDFRAEQYVVNTVSSYTAGAYRLAIRHLQQLGHERIGYIGLLGSLKENVYKYPKFAAALAENGLPNNHEFHCYIPAFGGSQPPTKDWIDKTRMILHEWFEKGPAVTAAICKNDYIAKVLIDVMHERNLEPGKDFSFIGHGNIEVRSNSPAPKAVITTIDNPEEIIGRRCGESLLIQIQDKCCDIVHEHIPVNFIIRETTGPCKNK